jgi:HPt (histidine-containing phosphotransfer) domain-containing protein
MNFNNNKKKPSDMSETNLFNLDKLRSYVGNNNADVKDMIALFLEIIPAQKQKLQNALNKSDWGTLNYISHQIKPSLDILGLNATKEKARAIESLAKTGNEEEVIRKFVTELCQELDAICKNLRTEMEKL